MKAGDNTERPIVVGVGIDVPSAALGTATLGPQASRNPIANIGQKLSPGIPRAVARLAIDSI